MLASRFGDCKAHATILKALLAAQGIEANLVTVNAGLQYTLTEVATPNFDHAIAYVPAIDTYLDPTVSLQAFGSLPSNLGGKPALLPFALDVLDSRNHAAASPPGAGFSSSSSSARWLRRFRNSFTVSVGYFNSKRRP